MTWSFVIIGILYWTETINGTIAAVLVVGAVLFQTFEGQQKKIDELTSKLEDVESNVNKLEY